MNPFVLLFCLVVGALSLGAPVSGYAQERAQSLSTSGATKPGKSGKATNASGRARLKLEPLDLTLESEPQLKISASLGEVSDAPAKQRAQAAALWQALNTSPEDVLRNAQRGQALAADLDKLRETMTRNTEQLAELRLQLAQAQESRARWRYAMMAAVAVSLLLVVLAWRRSAGQSRDAKWWRDSYPSLPPSAPNPSLQSRFPK